MSQGYTITETVLRDPVWRFEEDGGRLGVYRFFVYRGDTLVCCTPTRVMAERLVRLLSTDEVTDAD